jgi:hypothetical protein
MPRRRKPQSLAQVALDLFQKMSINDLKDLRDLLSSMVEPEPPSPELPRGSRQGGYFESKNINGRAYIYYRYRSAGILKSLYIGKERNEPELTVGIEGLGAMRTL